MAVTKQDLDNKIDLINRVFALDLERSSQKSGLKRLLASCLTTAECYQWLLGFEKALSWAYPNGLKKCNGKACNRRIDAATCGNLCDDHQAEFDRKTK